MCTCMCVPVRAVARFFVDTFTCTHTECELYVYELLLAVSPHSGMCVPVRAVARSVSEL